MCVPVIKNKVLGINSSLTQNTVTNTVTQQPYEHRIQYVFQITEKVLNWL